MRCWIADLPWTEVAARLQQGAVAILPIGAAAKEHGPHLPCGSDYIQARYFAEQLAASNNSLIWPVVSYGYYPAFSDYPGSVSLDQSTFAEMVLQITGDIDAAGASVCVILNTGISTIAPLASVIARGPSRLKLALLNCYQGRHFSNIAAECEEQSHGGHADEIETSIMLAIGPGGVDMSKAVANERAITRGRFNRSDQTSPNYSPSGVNGDPRLASVAKGRRLVAAIVADLNEGLAAIPPS